MKDKNQVSALLGVCIIPQVIADLKGFYDDQEEFALKEFYKSNLFDKLQNPQTGLWHLSSKMLVQLYLSEIREQQIEYPEEQS